eukprot:scaffold33780_cov98-Isochrysis_galbana.AAC.1
MFGGVGGRVGVAGRSGGKSLQRPIGASPSQAGVRSEGKHLREQRVCLLRKLGPPWVCRVRVHGSHVAEVLAGQSAAEGHV